MQCTVMDFINIIPVPYTDNSLLRLFICNSFVTISAYIFVISIYCKKMHPHACHMLSAGLKCRH